MPTPESNSDLETPQIWYNIEAGSHLWKTGQVGNATGVVHVPGHVNEALVPPLFSPTVGQKVRSGQNLHENFPISQQFLTPPDNSHSAPILNLLAQSTTVCATLGKQMIKSNTRNHAPLLELT